MAVLEHRDFVASLAAVPHLFSGYARDLPEAEVWDDESNDEDDDWVVP